MIARYKVYREPVFFYNLQIASEFSKNLDRQFHLCENLQASLLTKLQILDERRKLLSEHLREIREEYVLLLLNHLQQIQKISKWLTDI